MNILKYIILSLVIIWIITVIIFYIIFSSHRIYCFVYKHKSWKLWNKICKHLKEAKLVSYCADNNGTIIFFRFKLVISSIEYDIIYWNKDNTVSVHYKDECVLSDFDKYHSNKAAEIIKHYFLI